MSLIPKIYDEILKGRSIKALEFPLTKSPTGSAPISKDLVAVQPMPPPLSQFFYFDYVYDSGVTNDDGQSLTWEEIIEQRRKKQEEQERQERIKKELGDMYDEYYNEGNV